MSSAQQQIVTNVAVSETKSISSELVIPSQSLSITRLPQHLKDFAEIKDPSVVEIDSSHYLMFASIGNSVTQKWQVGRFEASTPYGPWFEVEPVKFIGISGPQLCAPAVVIDKINGKRVWHMYIQTACFEEDGIIVEAFSYDGRTFIGTLEPVISKQSIRHAPVPVVGVYDVGISEIKQGNDSLTCMLYSGYRRIGCGDLYMSVKSKHQKDWVGGECVLLQEHVSFHNRPDYEHFEWGLEGAKLIQLAEDCFVLIGVCFKQLSHEFLGTRQRVFLAASSSFMGPFTPIGMPFEPAGQSGRFGENGHPEAFIKDNNLMVIYQERDGATDPWYLRAASIDTLLLHKACQQSYTSTN